MTLRVAFDGFWHSFSNNNLFIDILKAAFPTQKISIVQNGSADILFVSVFPRMKTVNAILTVCFNGENKLLHEIPNCDLLLGYMPCGFDRSRFIELPLLLFLLYGPAGTHIYSYKQKMRLFSGIDYRDWVQRLDKCIVLLSNPADQRLKYVEQLGKTLQLDKYGRAFSKPVPGCREGKMKLLSKYRYHYCSENTYSHGYVTEKLFDSVAAGCIPIYESSNLTNLKAVSINVEAIYDESTFMNPQAKHILDSSLLLGIPLVTGVISKVNLFTLIGNKIRDLYIFCCRNSTDIYVCHYVPNAERQTIINQQRTALQKSSRFQVITKSDASTSRVFQNLLLQARSRYKTYSHHYNAVSSVLSIHAYAVAINGGSITHTHGLDIPKIQNKSPEEISASELSLNLKHRTALARFLMSPFNLCIVLEDDAIPVSNTYSVVKSLAELLAADSERYLYIDIGGGCRLNYCEYSGVTSSCLYSNHKLYDVIYPSSRTTCAYLVNKKFASYFLTHYPRPLGPIDFEYLFCLQALHKQSSLQLTNQWLDPPAFVHGSQEHFLQSSIQK
jgi:hypothetical protein